MRSRILEQLAKLLSSSPILAWGIGDISGLHPMSQQYPKALSILVSYEPTFQTYSEEEYHKLLEKVGAQIESVTSAVCDLFESTHIEHRPIDQGGQDPITLLGIFPHKLAAVRAGLGWIGKSSLLITEQCGPRVRLATILVSFEFPCNSPITRSKCGDCVICAEACPFDCIQGANWSPGLSREQLLKAQLCSSKRESFRSIIGHKHECGLCLLACPFGKKGVMFV